MADLESSFLALSLIGVALTMVFSIIAFISRRRAVIASGAEAGNSVEVSQEVTTGSGGMGIAASFLTALTILFITLTIIFRGIQSGHGPFSNMYEFALAFSWGIVVMGTIFQWRYKTAAVKNVGLIVALLLLVFAMVQHSSPEPLVPALQQSTLLSAHVASAVVAYGTFTVGFGAAILFLFQNSRNSSWLPDKEILDKMSYQSVIIGFPFLTLLIVLGALWADIAWGKYCSSHH